jgi:hypothetical protein
VPCPPARRGNQEQTQIIATAIGKPKAKATAIVDVNAESKFTPGCTLSSSDMALLHGSEKEKKPSPGQNGDGFSLAHTCPEGTNEWCSDIVNEVLTAQDGYKICSQSRTLPLLRPHSPVFQFRPAKLSASQGETIVTKPTINPNGTSPGELLEQHLLAINGLRSAISTLVAAAPNGRDYQPPTDTFRRVQIDHARPARTARKRDGRTGAVRRIYFGSVRHAALTNVMSARIGKMAECAVNRGTHQTISGFGRSGDAVGEGKIRRQRIPSDGVISRSASMRELDGADHKDYRTRAH